jgi:hypothetical protein
MITVPLSLSGGVSFRLGALVGVDTLVTPYSWGQCSTLT